MASARRMGVPGWGLFLAVLVASWSPLAVRAAPPRVYVVSVPAAPEHELTARELAALARAALAEAEGFRIREADAVLRGDLAAAHDTYAAGLTALSRGRQGYLGFELDAAEASLQEALARFAEAIPVIDSPEPVAQALMYLGASHVLAGDLAAARTVFARYHAAFAELAPDDRVFNPQVMQQWKEARQKLDQKPRGKLVVETSSPLAEITVDGRVRGVGASLTVDELAPGDHTLRVAVPGAAPFATPFTLRPRETARISATTGPERAELVPLLAQAGDLAQAANLQQALGVDALAVLRVGSDASGVQGVQLLAVGAVEPVEDARPLPSDVAQRAQTVRSLVAVFLERVARRIHADERRLEPEPLAKTPFFPVEQPPAPAPARAWYKRGWVWAVVGGVVLAGVGAGVAIAVAKKPSGADGDQPDGASLTLEF
jgi:hypothetical protein